MSHIFFLESIPITNLSLFLSFRPLMTAECRAARLLKFKADWMRELHIEPKSQVRFYHPTKSFLTSFNQCE
jgi:hypothetical protein